MFGRVVSTALGERSQCLYHIVYEDGGEAFLPEEEVCSLLLTQAAQNSCTSKSPVARSHAPFSRRPLFPAASCPSAADSSSLTGRVINHAPSKTPDQCIDCVATTTTVRAQTTTQTSMAPQWSRIDVSQGPMPFRRWPTHGWASGDGFSPQQCEASLGTARSARTCSLAEQLGKAMFTLAVAMLVFFSISTAVELLVCAAAFVDHALWTSAASKTGEEMGSFGLGGSHSEFNEVIYSAWVN